MFSIPVNRYYKLVFPYLIGVQFTHTHRLCEFLKIYVGSEGALYENRFESFAL